MQTKILPSYLYSQYTGHDSTQYLQPFFDAYNTTAQQYLDQINNLNLPIYTRSSISGDLLDWVALGIYGLKRPVIPQGYYKNKGEYNTTHLNEGNYNALKKLAPSAFYNVTDDIFKRCITWNFYKGDGYQFNIRWLKNRIARFLGGVNGTDPKIDNTYQISVTFAATDVVNINIKKGILTSKGGALLDTFELDQVPINNPTFFKAYIPTDLFPILQAAINAGVLQLPFQYTYNLTLT